MGSTEAIASLSPVVEAVSETPIEASFIVRAIERRIVEFGRTLTNGEAAKFKKLREEYHKDPEHNLSPLVDQACWDWAQSGVMYDESIELRSLYFAHRLVTAAAADQHALWQEKGANFRPLSYGFPYGDFEYYNQVDQRVARHIGNVVMANPTVTELLAVPQDQYGLPLGPFALIQTNRITRSLTFCPDGQPNMASYKVLPIGFALEG